MPSTSRAWFVDRYGGPERLVLRERRDLRAGRLVSATRGFMASPLGRRMHLWSR